MRRLLLLLCLGALAGGCASETTAIPFCESGEAAQALADAQCRLSPEGQTFEAELRNLLEPSGGPLLLRAGLDEGGRLAGVCGVRSVGQGQWRARARVGEALAGLPALPRGPACMANARLDLNEAGFAFAHVEEAVRQCEREADDTLRTNPAFGRAAIQRSFLQCVEAAQLRRNELWILVPQRGAWRIFVPAETPSPRRRARLACGVRDLAQGTMGQPSTGVARPGSDEKLVSCLAAQGWRAFP